MITTAAIYRSPLASDPAATFAITATMTGSVLKVTAVVGTPILAGQPVLGLNVPPNTVIVSNGSGTGGTGTYNVNTSATVPSESMTMGLNTLGLFAGAGSLWYQTDTFNLYIRNTANTAWTLIGSVNTTNFGLLPRSGGALSGGMIGSTGLMTTDGNTPFTYVPYVISKLSQCATMADLASLSLSLDEQIATAVTQQIQAIGVPSLRSSLVFSLGTMGTLNTGPSASRTLLDLTTVVAGLTYPDGSAVNISDCYGFASINSINPFGAPLSLNLTMVGTVGMEWYCDYSDVGFTTFYTGTINYLIMAIKPTA